MKFRKFAHHTDPYAAYHLTEASPLQLVASMAFERATNIQFDADGDTLLLLEEGTVQFQVSSSVLCLASPVFHAMLGANGKFKESKSLRERKDGEPPTEITLRDDNADALAVIFRILHHQHDSVPKSLSEENLWQIAILVDKYDLREATKLWVDLWIPHHFSDVGLPLALNSYFRDDRGVFLAYAFCNEIMFESISKNIILTWCATTDEYRLHPSFFSFTPSFEFVPQSIAGIYILLLFHRFGLMKLRGTLSQSEEMCRRDMQLH